MSERLLAPFQRITSSGLFIREIDGLRFLAILSVIVYHLAGDIMRHSTPDYNAGLAGSVLFQITQHLNIGVELFFVISGFILGLPFALHHLNARPRVSLKKYFKRRLTRLEPPYILALLLLFALKLVAGRGGAAQMLPHLIASLVYLHLPIYGSPSTIDFVAWSLEIEVQFYMLAPLLALLFAIRSRVWRRLAISACCLAFISVGRLLPGHVLVVRTLLGFGQYFLAGFLLVDLYLAARTSLPDWRWDLVSLAGWGAFLALLLRDPAWFAWTAPFLLVLLYFAIFRGVRVRNFFCNPWISTIGGMCYSIYLLHNYEIAALGQWTERWFAGASFSTRLMLQLALMGPVILVLCGTYFVLIEKPCMRVDWLPRLWSRLIAAPASQKLGADAAS